MTIYFTHGDDYNNNKIENQSVDDYIASTDCYKKYQYLLEKIKNNNNKCFIKLDYHIVSDELVIFDSIVEVTFDLSGDNDITINIYSDEVIFGKTLDLIVFFGDIEYNGNKYSLFIDNEEDLSKIVIDEPKEKINAVEVRYLKIKDDYSNYVGIGNYIIHRSSPYKVISFNIEDDGIYANVESVCETIVSDTLVVDMVDRELVFSEDNVIKITSNMYSQLMMDILSN